MFAALFQELEKDPTIGIQLANNVFKIRLAFASNLHNSYHDGKCS